MNTDKKEIGRRIKQALDVAGINQRTLAEKLGVVEATITGYVQGRTEPSGTGFATIAELTSVTLKWLITGKGPMRNESIETSGYAIGAEPDGSAPADEEMEDLPKPFIEVIKEGHKLTLANQYRIAADMLDKIGELIEEEERKKRKE
jgi:transcriptional regulator with XRE-family HTH domain